MARQVRQSTQFKRDIKRLTRQGADLAKLETVVIHLVGERPLAERHRDYALTGNWRGYRDCHIEPDWLLLYRIVGDELQLTRTGSHAELFGR